MHTRKAGMQTNCNVKETSDVHGTITEHVECGKLTNTFMPR